MVNIFKHRKINKNPFVKYLKAFSNPEDKSTLRDYTNFYFCLKAGANLGKLYDEGADPFEELKNESLNLLICVNHQEKM